jgi:octaprenyl-diphosphate synthase
MDWVRQSLGSDWKAFENVLKTALDSPYALLSVLDEYILNKPGKQIRPALALSAAGVCGTPGSLSHAVAAIAEMIHTASLLHDDVADNAQTRRGKESVQKQFGPHAAIVLGDFWLARAFQVLLQHNGTHLLPLYADVIEDLSQGELFQMEKAKTLDVTPIEYYTICKKKTASLFYAAIMSGAMSVPEKEKAAEFKPLLEHAAYHMGMAFQIRDDL